MTIDELFNKMRESLQAKVVYGEPYEKDGVTVIPAAVVLGGGGGGGGRRTGGGRRDEGAAQDVAAGQGAEGEGGGFGLVARPAGAFVIENGTVRWQPALDPARLILAGVLVLFAVTRQLRRRRRRAARAKARLQG